MPSVKGSSLQTYTTEKWTLHLASLSLLSDHVFTTNLMDNRVSFGLKPGLFYFDLSCQQQVTYRHVRYLRKVKQVQPDDIIVEKT